MPSTTNFACFRHLKGNCACNDPMNISIGKQLRCPKGGDKKRWREFATFMYKYNNYYADEINELKIFKHLGITPDMLNRQNRYEAYQGQCVAQSRKRSCIRSLDISRIERKLGNIEERLSFLKQMLIDFPDHNNDKIKADIKLYEDNFKRMKLGRKYIMPRGSPKSKKLINILYREDKLKEIPDIFRPKRDV